MTIDFITYTLHRKNEKIYDFVPGVLIEHAAKTTHRHRQGDLFALYLSFSGDHQIEDGEIAELKKKASGIFFHSQGSVTHAIKAVIEHLNKQISDRNLNRGYEDTLVEGSVNITVLHKNWLFIGQAGDAQTYSINDDGFQRFGEDGSSTEKLGQVKRLQPRFYQREINVGDLILMSPKSHASWKAYYLAGSNALSMTQVKDKLQNQMIQDFSVLVIKTAEGKGQVIEGDWNAEIETSPMSEADKFSADLSLADQIVKNQEFGKKSVEESIESEVKTLSTDEEDLQEKEEIRVTAGETEEISGQTSLSKGHGIKNPGRWIKGVARLWMRWKTFRSKIQLNLGRFNRKILRGKLNTATGESLTWLTIAALMIPLVLILSSLSVYTRFGKDEQHKVFLDQAEEIRKTAEDEDDVIKQKDLWKDVLSLTVQAEEYKVTTESRQLFQTAQSIVDEMELTARLDFRPALTELFPEGASISRIKAGASGVYLLDSNSGNVLRIFLNTKGFYELDEEFRCTPGPYGLTNVTEIIDFIILPANSENYKIMSLDGSGNLLYCQPGEPPVSRTLTIPAGGWDRIIGTAYGDDALYVLDAGKNMIWVYRGSDASGMSGIVFTESPISYFTEDSPDLGGAIQASLNQEDLYILHADGHMTLCQNKFIEDKLVSECEDPAPYTDNRVGSENKNPWIFMGTHFTGLEKTRLPNVSLFVLDDVSGALYQFSFQLNLERTLKPQYNQNYPIPDSKPSGFGITPDREIFMAYDNQLFIAPLQ